MESKLTLPKTFPGTDCECWWRSVTVSANAGRELSNDALSELPCFYAAQTWSKWSSAPSLPPHKLMGADCDEEDATGNDGLVDETTVGRLIAIRGK